MREVAFSKHIDHLARRLRELGDEEQLLAVIAAASRRLPGEPRARPTPSGAALQLAHQEAQVSVVSLFHHQ